MIALATPSGIEAAITEVRVIVATCREREKYESAFAQALNRWSAPMQRRAALEAAKAAKRRADALELLIAKVGGAS